MGRLRVVVAAMVAMGLSAAARADDRLPAPSTDDAARAEKLVKELFKDEYSKTRAADRIALATKLLQQAGETKDDAAARYVLLREARDVAAKAGDGETAMKAAEGMAAEFRVGPGEVRAAIAEHLVTASSASTAQRTAELLVTASETALASGEWEAAVTILKAAESAASKAKNVQLAINVRARVTKAEAMKAEADKVKVHLETLKTKPDDPEANLAAGRFLSLLKQDWQAGVAMLAKGSDAKLKAAAEKDLKAAAGTEAEQVAAADSWYDLAAESDAAVKPALQIRAHHWYQKALPTLTGLTKVKAEKRVGELEKVAEGSGGVKSDWFIVFRAVDCSIWNKDVNRGKDFFAVSLTKVPDKIEYLKLTNTRTGEYVIVAVSKENLGTTSDDGRYGWNGTNKFEYDGYHLGIYDRQLDVTKGPPRPCVWVPGAFQGLGGWGYGHKNKRTMHTWEGKDLPPNTVFEIAVKAGPLTDAESRKLLKK